MSQLSSDQVARFWAKVAIGEANECWPWTAARAGGRDGETYGVLRISNPRRMFYAHRLSYAISSGIDPHLMQSSVVVRHSCDNGLCCNPNHLLTGTQKDNATDMATRGRSLRGERQPTHKLTTQQVIEAKRRLANGDRHKDIADSFGVSRTAITQISVGKNWSWLADNDNTEASQAT